MKTIYVLADVYEREVCITKYNTYEDAYRAMKYELDLVLGFDSTDKVAAEENGYAPDFDFQINEWSAWSNVGDQNNDWVIEKFEI